MIGQSVAFNYENSQFMGTAAAKKIPQMTDPQFEEWRKYIYNMCGIYFQTNKKYLLESRLSKRMGHLKIDNYDRYLDLVKGGIGSAEERNYLYEAITINETFFFRNQPQLDALVSSVVPEIYASKSNFGQKKLKIWSAASSSGEEAYSISIIFNELIKPKYRDLELEIVGTDINRSVIDTANQGIYRDYSIRNAPSYYLRKYFIKNANYYEIDSSVKKNVRFEMLNLYDDAAMSRMVNFDVIFCANVLIYFDAKSKSKVVSHLYNSLNKNGYLFIGYSETLHTITKAFKLVSYPKAIGYKKEL